MAEASREPRLTALSHGAGCACKLPAEALTRVLEFLPSKAHENLIVDHRSRDDAAVYRLTEDLALVLTADFFTPIVDDPFNFGRIAAANALSDIYAMGARPMIALNLLGFPLDLIDQGRILERILRGATEVLDGAGVVLGGGHSIDDPEPKFGLAVAGVVKPSALITNDGARPGDAIYLSKPVGGGIATTAAKRGLASKRLIDRATKIMCELNADAADAARLAGANAMTDVSGFGLLGHLHEVCEASGLAAKIDAVTVPVIEEIRVLARDERCISGGSRRNLEHSASFARFPDSIGAADRVIFCDAMTSGGLLVAADPTGAAVPRGARIGSFEHGPTGLVEVVDDPD